MGSTEEFRREWEEVTSKMRGPHIMVKQVEVGDVVLYHPDKRSPDFHDRGHQPILPGIVVKVWASSEVVNLRVADQPVEGDKIDMKVFLDHNVKDSASFVWVFGATYGEGVDQWTKKP